MELTRTNRPFGLTVFVFIRLPGLIRLVFNVGASLIAPLHWHVDLEVEFIFLGDHTGGATPVPIPNTAVKPSRADGTAWATGWESRSLPGLFIA